MTGWLLTGYVLVWPVIVAVVLVVLCRGFVAEWRAARREGRRVI